MKSDLRPFQLSEGDVADILQGLDLLCASHKRDAHRGNLNRVQQLYAYLKSEKGFKF